MMMKTSSSTTFRSRALLLMTFSLFLVFAFARAAGPNPVFPISSPAESLPEVMEAEDVGMEETCEGTWETEECLMRRTLAAHLDYIYTQKQRN